MIVKVRPSSVYEFEVIDRDGQSWAVNLTNKTCTCRMFQIDNFICPHGIACCRFRNYVVEDYISLFYSTDYWKSSYTGVIHPHGNVESWLIPDNVKQIIVKPPSTYARQAGRPKKRRIPSQGEGNTNGCRKCSRCGGVGHNRATCRSPIPLNEMQ